MIRVQRSGLAMAPSCPFPNARRLPGNTAKPTINSRLALPYHVMKYGLPQVSRAHDHADSLREYQHQSCRGSFSDGQAGTKHRTEWSWPPAKGTKQFDLSFSARLHYSSTLPSLDGGLPSVCCLMSSLHASTLLA
jgi:hypothetical protein